MPPARGTKPVIAHLRDRDIHRLAQLTELLGTNKTETIRRAIHVALVILDAQLQGHPIIIEDPDRTYYLKILT